MTATLKDRALNRVFVTLLTLTAVALAGGSLAAQTPAIASPEVTFTKEVAPILQQHCQECHRPNAIAPMSLQTFEEVRPFAKAIKERTSARMMPPWFIDPNVGINKFKNYGGLTDDEIAIIAKWVDAGAPRGNPADMPPPAKFDDDIWHIGTPELVAAMPADLAVTANGPDMWRNIVVDPGLTEDRYIKAVEIKPTKGRRVIHHMGTTLLYPDGGSATMQSKNANIFEDGSGRLMKAGTKVVFQLHVHPYREDTSTNVEIGFKFYPKGYVPKYVAQTELMGDDHELDLPANSDNVRYDSYKILTNPTRILAYAPHMHTRAKAQCLEAILPEKSEQRDGNKVETLSCINHFDFNWMMVYEYATDAQPLLPVGTVLHLINWYNNTGSNRLNNDPDNWIGYGQRSIDDMAMAWMTFYNLSQKDFEQQVAERKAKLKEMESSSRSDTPNVAASKDEVPKVTASKVTQ
jgi:mono/diheme cytochrome c family protein